MTSSQTITLTARQLKAVIDPVLPFAGNDWMLPVLRTVAIETRGKWLVAATTDRFRVGMKRLAKPKSDDDDEPTVWPEFRALLKLDDAKHILSTFKPTRGSDPELSVTVRDATLTVTAGRALFDGFTSATIGYDLELGQFPKLAPILAKALAQPEPGPGNFALNPKFLADFKRAADFGLTFRVGAGPKDPILVTDRENFIGAIMPRTLHGEETPAESWDEILGVEPAEEVAS